MYKFVTEREVRNLVNCAVSAGKCPEQSDEDVKNLTEQINQVMHTYDQIEKLPYGRDKYKPYVDSIFSSLVEN